MKSYQYFIELLIAGAGALVWVVLLSVDVFGIQWFQFEYQLLQKMSDGIFFALVMLIFPFLFVAGIITDRVSDYLFDKTANIKISKKHFSCKEDYQNQSDHVYEIVKSSKSLRIWKNEVENLSRLDT